MQEQSWINKDPVDAMKWARLAELKKLVQDAVHCKDVAKATEMEDDLQRIQEQHEKPRVELSLIHI